MRNRITDRSDEELYLLILDKSSQSNNAFEELYSRYSTNLYTYCFKILNDRQLANDIFQEAFIKLLETQKATSNMTNIAAYLFRIARNLCLNEKQKKYHAFVTIEDLNLSINEDIYEQKEQTMIIESALDALPPKFKEILILKEYLDKSYQEIADILEISVSSVRIRIYRAKERLRQILQPYFLENNQD
ncbi:MAG: RNA polymerase sigma factor [Candidatus Kapabacteria bacterium]|nr:RNA polymerase sigma factor [Candidatus Kapabacteria bacterium]